MSALASTELTFATAAQEFEQAWHNPSSTRFVLPPADVNKILGERYHVAPHKPLTRAMIWDMERRKAWDPFAYIPYVVSDASSWGRHTLRDGAERFSRASTQVGWITQERGLVLEDVYVNDVSQTIVFLGRRHMADVQGGGLVAATHQPLFHVEHSVGGPEDAPLNLWRIVLMTAERDARYEEPFKQMVRAGFLPGFVELYIKNDLGLELARR